MNKVALVFGSSSTIGSHIVVELLKRDYIVYGTYYHTRTELPTYTIKCDIRDIGQVDNVFKEIGHLDVMVLSAFPFQQANPFSWTAFEESNRIYTGHMRAIHNAANWMGQNGKIVNILGQCVRNGLPSAPHYSAAFAAMHNFGKSVNGSHGKSKLINFIDVLLAAVDTKEWQNVSSETRRAYKAKMSQFISPQEVANRVMFELSCEVMATELVVDGYVLV